MKPGIMSNRTYYIVLLLVLIIYFVLAKFYFTNGKFIIWCAVPVVIFIICKDAFTGIKWFQGQPTVKHTPVVAPVAVPVSDDVKQGYRELLHLLVAPAYHAVLESAIQNLKTIDDTNDENTPLYSLAQLADENNIAFIMGLDWKAAIEDIEWRISSALKQNFDTVITLPDPGQWPPRTSISADGVIATYNNTLKANGFELGLIDTQSDEYILLVLKNGQQEQVRAAVKLTGYNYINVSDRFNLNDPV